MSQDLGAFIFHVFKILTRGSFISYATKITYLQLQLSTTKYINLLNQTSDELNADHNINLVSNTNINKMCKNKE